MTKTILITGATGNISSGIITQLRRTKGSGIYFLNRALRKLTRAFWFSCGVIRAAARNNSEDPRFFSLQRSELLRQDQG